MKLSLVWATLLVALPCAATANTKIAKDLDYQSKQGDVDVIVQFANAASDQDLAGVTQKGGRLTARVGKVAAFHLPGNEVESVAGQANVIYVAPDRALRGQVDY